MRFSNRFAGAASALLVYTVGVVLWGAFVRASLSGDGCGANLSWWLGPAPYAKPGKPTKPKPPMTLAGLPGECRNVLAAPSPGMAGAEVNIPLPVARPAIN